MSKPGPVSEAVILDAKRDWREAALARRPNDRVSSLQFPHPVHGCTVEATNPDRIHGLDDDAVITQSLLIRERILGPRHPQTVTQYFRYATYYAVHTENLSRALTLLRYGVNLMKDVRLLVYPFQVHLFSTPVSLAVHRLAEVFASRRSAAPLRDGAVAIL
jgi:hypothetical protein